MPNSPSRRLERLAELLIPPASAEHALGDLAESSRSNREYRRNLLSILPRVVWYQTRRRATLGGMTFNTIVTTLVLAPCLGFPKAPLFAESWVALRIAAPLAIWVIGSALALAYGPRDKPHGWNWTLYVGALLSAVLAALVLGIPVAGAALGFGIVFVLSIGLTMPWVTHSAPPPLSMESLPVYARNFQRTIWWRNLRESIACGFVLWWSLRSFWSNDGPVERAGFVLITAGVLFVLVFLNAGAASRKVPRDADTQTLRAFHRREVVRQRDVLLAVPYWYLLPFVPGMILLVFSNPHNQPLAALFVFVAVLALVFYGIWRLNVWAARRLDQELLKIDALEPQS
ncbi:MAG TPA: hypothetical protein VH436_28820 [Vicinamibacterales bacterium]|jgi:hypothetical protein